MTAHGERDVTSDHSPQPTGRHAQAAVQQSTPVDAPDAALETHRGGRRKGKRSRHDADPAAELMEEELDGGGKGSSKQHRKGGVPVQRQREELSRMLRESARAGLLDHTERLRHDQHRLGRCQRGLIGSPTQSATAVQWEGGTDGAMIDARKKRISDQKQELEKLKKPPKKDTQQDDEAWEQKELVLLKQIAINREEAEVQKMAQQLEVERRLFNKTLLVAEVLERPRFPSSGVLRERYQVQKLEAVASFTEVYSGYDLVELNHKTIRLHSSRRDLSEAEREAWVSLLSVDCEAYQKLRNRSLATLLDHFVHHDEVSRSHFYVSVWEAWEAETLDVYLLRHGPMLEKEARGVVLQLVSALRCMDTKGFAFNPDVFQAQRLLVRGGEIRVIGLVARESAGSHKGGRPRVATSLDGSFAESEDIEEDSMTLTQTMRAVHSPAQRALRIIGDVLYAMLYNRDPESASGMIDMGKETPSLPEQPKISSECRDFLTKLLDKEQSPNLPDVDKDAFLVSQRQRG